MAGVIQFFFRSSIFSTESISNASDLLSYVTDQQIKTSERDLLENFHRETSQHESWCREKDWDSSAPLQTWEGVTVRDETVIGLKLNYNRLQGQNC